VRETLEKKTERDGKGEGRYKVKNLPGAAERKTEKGQTQTTGKEREEVTGRTSPDHTNLETGDKL